MKPKEEIRKEIERILPSKMTETEIPKHIASTEEDMNDWRMENSYVRGSNTMCSTTADTLAERVVGVGDVKELLPINGMDEDNRIAVAQALTDKFIILRKEK